MLARAAVLEQILAEKATCARITGATIVVTYETLDAIRHLVHKAVVAIDECDRARLDLAAAVRSQVEQDSRWGIGVGMRAILGLPLVLIFWNWWMYRLCPADYGATNVAQ